MLAGPYGSMLLADMGAEVIKIEDPDGGDPMRVMGPPFLPDGESAYFLAINRNKKSVALDLAREAGREVFYDLVRQADVVWENFRPGVMERLGGAYSKLWSLNQRVILCSISAYGQEGPYRDWPAFDLALQAMGGAMSITGEPGRSPVRMGLPMGDLTGGIFGAFAVAGALFRRERTGEGAHIDLSLLDCQVSLLTYVAQYFWTNGRVPGPLGSGHASVVPYQALATRDGHLIVAVFAEKFWSGFCRVVEHPEWERDLRFTTNRDRVANREVLVPLVEAAFRRRTTDDWLGACRRRGCPARPSAPSIASSRIPRCGSAGWSPRWRIRSTASSRRSARRSRWTARWGSRRRRRRGSESTPTWCSASCSTTGSRASPSSERPESSCESGRASRSRRRGESMNLAVRAAAEGEASL